MRLATGTTLIEIGLPSSESIRPHGAKVKCVAVVSGAVVRFVQGASRVAVGETRPDRSLRREDRPGAMGAVARRIAEAGVNIEQGCTTFGAVRLVLGVVRR